MLMGGYVLFFGPRVYECSATYVVVAPNTPSDREMERDKSLAKLNSDNPYIRGTESGLIVKVVVARMSGQPTQLDMKAAGLSTDYSVAQSAESTMTVLISAFADTPERAFATRQWLLDDLGRQLRDLQKVNGADDRFLFTALPVDVTREPVEKVSSRLRSLIVTLAAGAILVMGVVSVAAAIDRRRKDVLQVPSRTSTESASTKTPGSGPATRTRGVTPSSGSTRLHLTPSLPDQNTVELSPDIGSYDPPPRSTSQESTDISTESATTKKPGSGPATRTNGVTPSSGSTGLHLTPPLPDQNTAELTLDIDSYDLPPWSTSQESTDGSMKETHAS
jgi:hypothetical protein